jgi:hypothetical protein
MRDREVMQARTGNTLKLNAFLKTAKNLSKSV